jgi:hypothetical protein
MTSVYNASRGEKDFVKNAIFAVAPAGQDRGFRVKPYQGPDTFSNSVGAG